MKFSAVFLSAVYLASVMCQEAKPPISITSPLANTKIRAGSEFIISWVNPKIKTISQITLSKGSSTSLQPLMTVAKDVNASDLKYVWKVPMELSNGEDYALVMGTSPDLAFTGAFSIEGGTGGPLPAQNTTSSQPSSGQTNPSRPSNGSSSSSPNTTPGAPTTKPADSPNTPHASSASSLYSQVGLLHLGALGLASVAAQYLL
ncbi:hypothetical protein BY458DRAFT_482568 [Sporodiniella umbellata]|nr:hypothetical protein BY458DRAFT_482568 [Sporodiniella umbellata]